MALQNRIAITIILAVVGVGVYVVATNNNINMMDDEAHHGDEMVESHEIYPGDVVHKIEHNEDIVILDVRTPEEYEEVHLENALLLPVQELSAQSLAEIGLGESSKEREIIIYCRSGARSKTAHSIMKSLGYTNIRSVSGGMIHWQEDEYPFTETGPYHGAGKNIGVPDDEVRASGPRIAIESAFHDFGLVSQYGGTVQKSFNIGNDGTESLIIGSITTSCSCTSATITLSVIEPGAAAEITIVFDPDFHGEPLGVFKRTVFIATNDPAIPEAEIVIQVDIDEGI